MHVSIRKKAGLGAFIAAALCVGIMAPAAHADYAPAAGDITGVGSDTLQYLVDFGFDGDPRGDAGWNTAGNLNKAVNFDATADDNARLAYTNAAGSPAQNPTVTLRAGQFPVKRPNGSGDGFTSILADTSSTSRQIDFGRASSLPSTTQQGTAATNGWGGLHFIQLGTDPLAMAFSASDAGVPTTALPQNLSTATLKLIYNCTDTTIGSLTIGGTSTTTIHPWIPQPGSGTGKSFLADIGLASTDIGSCVKTGEENDPTAMAGDPDALEPMSGGRLSLWTGTVGTKNQGFFRVPALLGAGVTIEHPDAVIAADSTAQVSAAAATGATTVSVTKVINGTDGNALVGGTISDSAATPQTATITAVSGTAPNFVLTTSALGHAWASGTSVTLKKGPSTDGPTVKTYEDDRGLYVYFRDSDMLAVGASGSTNPGGFEPGSVLNFEQTLFYNPCTPVAPATTCTGFGPGGAPYMDTSAGQTLIAAAGINPTYIDAGDAHS
jgi:ABC-type phosphate transport system substrate-binding protein